MPTERRTKPALGRRFLGVPWLWAVAHSAIAFSVYYSLGVVADDALVLTPVIFAIAGLIYVLTTMTYVEGGAMFRERGGSNTLARNAFNELVSFVAGWAILIDYVIVIALAAVTVPHYLGPISADLASGTGEQVVAVAVVVVVAVVNIVGYHRQPPAGTPRRADRSRPAAPVPARHRRADRRLGPGGPDQLARRVRNARACAIWRRRSSSRWSPWPGSSPRRISHPISPGAARTSSNVLRAGTFVVPFVYVGMSLVALMALPVVAGPDGPTTALATTFEDAPVLGVISAFEPEWLSDVFKWAVVCDRAARPLLRRQRDDARPLPPRLRAWRRTARSRAGSASSAAAARPRTSRS